MLLAGRNLFGRLFISMAHSRRKLSKYVELPSSLYMNVDNITTVFSAVAPHIDIDNTFKNIDKLNYDLASRGVTFDVEYLHQQSVVYKQLLAYIKKIKGEIKDLNVALELLSRKKNNVDSVSDKISLQTKLSESTNRLLLAKEEFSLVETNFIYPFLQLPNSLHRNTGQEDEVIFSLFSKPQFSFKCKSHCEIGSRKGELFFESVSPTAYYLKGNLAHLELAVTEYLLDRLRKYGFTNCTCMDFAKAVLVEGCGIDVKQDDLIKIKDISCTASSQIKFLQGGSSLTAFVSMLSKSMITFEDQVPIKLTTCGRKYNYSNLHASKIGLFNSIQSTSVSTLVMYPCEAIEDTVYNEIAMLLIHLYTELGLHFKLIQKGASNLRQYESLAVEICMYSPYLEQYIVVGRVSWCQNYTISANVFKFYKIWATELQLLWA